MANVSMAKLSAKRWLSELQATGIMNKNIHPSVHGCKMYGYECAPLADLASWLWTRTTPRVRSTRESHCAGWKVRPRSKTVHMAVESVLS